MSRAWTVAVVMTLLSVLMFVHLVGVKECDEYADILLDNGQKEVNTECEEDFRLAADQYHFLRYAA